MQNDFKNFCYYDCYNIIFFKKPKYYQNEIIAYSQVIRSISIFTSGKVISVSGDKSIKIQDKNLNILQSIKNAHNDIINYVDIKDEKILPPNLHLMMI